MIKKSIVPLEWQEELLNDLSLIIASGTSNTQSEKGGIFVLYGSTGIIGYRLNWDYNDLRILIARVGANAGTVNIVDGEYCVSDNTLMLKLKPNVNTLFIFYFLKHSNLNKLVFGSGQPLITGSQLKTINVPLPPLPEQTAIATALSDMDELIAQTEKLIQKKKAIKQGVMQELLRPTDKDGKLKEGWVERKLGEVLKVKHGKSQKQIIVKEGKYPIMASGGIIGRTNTALYNKPSVLIGRKGTIDNPIYINRPFWCVDTLFFTEIFNEYCEKFVFYLFNLIDWYSYNEASGVPSLNAKTIERIERYFPENKQEQERIAVIITDLDNEIDILKNHLIKHQKLKQGMMQALLTGKIRIYEPVSEATAEVGA